jgi:hypothetical protein
MGEKRNACRLLVRNQEGMSPLRKPMPRYLHNIKIDIEEIG